MTTTMGTTLRSPAPAAAGIRPIEDPAGWMGSDLQDRTDWQYRFDQNELQELHDALQGVKARGQDIIGVTRRDFPLPTLAPRLAELRREVLDGRGFVLLRGLPVANYDRRDAATLYWGIGAHMGYPVSQNADGHMLGHVIDFGTRSQHAEVKSEAKHGSAVFLNPGRRGYNSSERLAFHIDFADIIGLCCLHPAKSGGESLIVSSIALHNEVLRTRPDLMPVLYEPFWIDRKGEIPAGGKPYFQMPIFNLFQERLTTYYSGGHMKTTGRFAELPPLTPQQREAMDLMDDLANDPRFRLSMWLEQGDIQLINNHVVLHARTKFEDFDEPERKRHLLRLWLVTPDGRPLPDWFYDRYGGGRRGGIYVPGCREFVPIDPAEAENA